MKYILIFSLVSATLSIHSGECSNMKKSIKDAEIEDGIIEKAQKKNAGIKSLRPEEREWIYKNELLEDLKDLKKQYKKDVNCVDYEDLTTTASKIAQFEYDKGNITVAREKYKEAARWFLEAALRGSTEHLAFLSGLTRYNWLNQSTLKEIEDEAVDEDSKPGIQSELLKDEIEKNERFIKLRDVLAQSLEKSYRNPNSPGRKGKRKPFVPDEVVNYIFQEKYKKQKSE